MAKRAHSSIGDVLNQLRDEFPDITISKIRFLESQGLVDPERTPSGYRKFYPADVERLRFILRQQREHFLPLKVIKERLDEIDKNGGFTATDARRADGDRRSGCSIPKTVDALFEETRRAAAGRRGAFDHRPGRRRRRARGARRIAESGVSLTRAELARAAGMTDDELGRLEEFGLVTPSHDRARPCAVRRRRARDRAGRARRSCATASSRATCACTARSPSARRACSSRCCCRTGGSAIPEAQARTHRDARRARRSRPAAAHRAAAPGGAPHVSG